MTKLDVRSTVALTDNPTPLAQQAVVAIMVEFSSKPSNDEVTVVDMPASVSTKMFVENIDHPTSMKVVAESSINLFAVVTYNPVLEDPELLNSIVRHQPNDSLFIDTLPDDNLPPKQPTGDITTEAVVALVIDPFYNNSESTLNTITLVQETQAIVASQKVPREVDEVGFQHVIKSKK